MICTNRAQQPMRTLKVRWSHIPSEQCHARSCCSRLTCSLSVLQGQLASPTCRVPWHRHASVAGNLTMQPHHSRPLRCQAAAAMQLEQQQHRQAVAAGSSITGTAAAGQQSGLTRRSCMLLARPTPARFSRVQRRALPPLAMVNVDFASPSLVLGVTLIGCGIALLQVCFACDLRILHSPRILQ